MVTMGYLKGYDNISRATSFKSQIPTELIFKSFQLQLFELIFKAYAAIRTPESINENPDETAISTSLFIALKQIAANEEIPLTVIFEKYEITDEIAIGQKSAISSKRFDIFFESWNMKQPIEFGIEAKLLIENNFLNRISSALIREYVSNAGMGKYLDGIYKKRGCMIGYIIEGNVVNIVEKINKQIEKILDNNQQLEEDSHINFGNEAIYKSKHHKKLDYDLYHLMLAFN